MDPPLPLTPFLVVGERGRPRTLGAFSRNHRPGRAPRLEPGEVRPGEPSSGKLYPLRMAVGLKVGDIPRSPLSVSV